MNISDEEITEKEAKEIPVQNSLIEFTQEIFQLSPTVISSKPTVKVPISELSLLGTSVSALVPKFRTITTNNGGKELFEIVNKKAGDVLQKSRDGNNWASFTNAEGKKIFAKLKLADATTSIGAIDPTTLMMAIALYKIEKQLSTIAKIQQEMLNFLEIEKESEIEADTAILTDIMANYKHNWSNIHYTSSNHKLALDIQRTAKKNLISYSKRIKLLLDESSKVVLNKKVTTMLHDLRKEFEYYRLSLYTYSLSSLIEVVLQGNPKSQIVNESIRKINALSADYREMFSICSAHLERVLGESLDRKLIKGFGNLSMKVGEFSSKIPMVKNTKVDDFFHNEGKKIKENVQGDERSILSDFSKLGNPNTYIFVDKMVELNEIYNSHSSIYFDNNHLYFVSEEK